MEVWQTSNVRRLRLGEEKKDRKNKRQDENIYGLPYYTGQPQTKNRNMKQHIDFIQTFQFASLWLQLASTSEKEKV